MDGLQTDAHEETHKLLVINCYKSFKMYLLLHIVESVDLPQMFFPFASFLFHYFLRSSTKLRSQHVAWDFRSCFFHLSYIFLSRNNGKKSLRGLLQTGGVLIAHNILQKWTHLSSRLAAENRSRCAIHIPNEDTNLSQGFFCKVYSAHPPPTMYDVWTLAEEAKHKPCAKGTSCSMWGQRSVWSLIEERVALSFGSSVKLFKLTSCIKHQQTREQDLKGLPSVEFLIMCQNP